MNTILHPNQSAVAKELGIDAAKLASSEEAIIAIETKLGKAAMEVRARWFVISVLRHLKKAKWTDLEDSAFDEASQWALVRACLAVDGFATSLRTVTKDNRSKFRFVGFASSKNVERGMLATGPKAYKIAASVVAEAGLLAEPAAASSRQPKSKARQESKQVPEQESRPAAKQQRSESKPQEKSAASRIHAARDSVAAKVTKTRAEAALQSSRVAGSAMSKEEFESLDAALSKSDAEIVQQSWTDQSNEDQWSRILGIVAGVGFFVFIALLFL